MILYAEPFVGSTAYPTGPALSTVPPTIGPSQSNYPPFNGWMPEFHKYRVIGSPGVDVMISFDGKNDHARIPAAGASGVLAPIQFDVAYQRVWARTTGATAQLSIGFYTKQ